VAQRDGNDTVLKIHFSPTNEWSFPAGTVFVKNFSLPVDETDPKILRRLETRLLVRDTDGTVYGASYKWRDDMSDADLVNTGITEPIEVRTATGTRVQNWFYPGRQDCLTCHTVASGGVLGVKTRQLNGDFTYPNGVTDNQLHALNHIGVFDSPLKEKEIPRFEKLVVVSDPHASLELRARSYLDANCAQCHRPGGAEAFFDVRFDTPLDQQKLVNGPVANSLGVLGARVVVPGDLNKSVLFHRIHAVGNLQMPPLAKNVVDEKAVALMAEWIQSLPPTTSSLPKNWLHADIGSVALPGDAGYLNQEFNLLASGADISGTNDAFHFVYLPFSGDGMIVARVKTLQFTDPWAKTGVMFRENLSAGSKHAFLAVTAEGNWEFQTRAGENELSRSHVGQGGEALRWIKLIRAGNVFTGYTSDDGKDWRATGSVTNSMSKKLYIGLTLTSHNNSVLNSALIDKVEVSQ
jgi:mono/diheme cytochrome c family protein